MDIIGSLLRCHPVFDHIFGCPQPWRPAWRRSAWPQRLRFFVASKIWGSNPVVVTASKLRTWRFHNFDSDILRSCSLHWFCFTRAHYIDFRLGDWVLSESFSSDVEDVPGTWGPKLPQRDDVVGYSPHFGFSYGAKSCETTQPYLTSILIQYLNWETR